MNQNVRRRAPFKKEFARFTTRVQLEKPVVYLPVTSPGTVCAYLKQAVRDKLIEHKQQITKHGEDVPGD